MKTRFAIAAVLALFGTVASAQEGVQDSAVFSFSSSLSRAEVVADMKGAELPVDEATLNAQATPSGGAAKRAQVIAEAREAMRLGLIPTHDGTRQATAADEAKIQLAGVRAVETTLASTR